MEDSSTKKEDQLQDSNGDNILQDSEPIFFDDDNSSSEYINDNYERKYFNEYTNMQISPPFRNEQLPFRSHPLGAMKKNVLDVINKRIDFAFNKFVNYEYVAYRYLKIGDTKDLSNY